MVVPELATRAGARGNREPRRGRLLGHGFALRTPYNAILGWQRDTRRHWPSARHGGHRAQVLIKDTLKSVCLSNVTRNACYGR